MKRTLTTLVLIAAGLPTSAFAEDEARYCEAMRILGPGPEFPVNSTDPVRLQISNPGSSEPLRLDDFSDYPAPELYLVGEQGLTLVETQLVPASEGPLARQLEFTREVGSYLLAWEDETCASGGTAPAQTQEADTFVITPEAVLPTALGSIAPFVNDSGIRLVTTVNLDPAWGPWVQSARLGLSIDGEVVEADRATLSTETSFTYRHVYRCGSTLSEGAHELVLRVGVSGSEFLAEPQTVEIECPPPAIDSKDGGCTTAHGGRNGWIAILLLGLVAARRRVRAGLAAGLGVGL